MAPVVNVVIVKHALLNIIHTCIHSFKITPNHTIRWQKLIPAIRSFRISYDLIIKLIPARVQELRHAAVGVALLAVVLLFIGLKT